MSKKLLILICIMIIIVFTVVAVTIPRIFDMQAGVVAAICGGFASAFIVMTYFHYDKKKNVGKDK